MALSDASSWDSMVLPLLSAIGTGFNVAGDTSIAQGSADASNFNATVNDQAAKIALSQGADAVARQQRNAFLVESAGRAAIGGSGLRASGSALDVLEASAIQAELDKQTIEYNARIKALGFTNSAQLDRLRAQAAITAGNTRAAADLINGATSIAGLLNKLPLSGAGTLLPKSVGTDMPDVNVGNETFSPIDNSGFSPADIGFD